MRLFVRCADAGPGSNQQQQPVTELDESKPGESFVRVKATPEQNNLIVFEIRIQHN